MVPRLVIVLATHSVREPRREIGYHIRLWFSPSSAVLRSDGIFKRQFLFLFLVWAVDRHILPGPWQLLQVVCSGAAMRWSDYGLQYLRGGIHTNLIHVGTHVGIRAWRTDGCSRAVLECFPASTISYNSIN